VTTAQATKETAQRNGQNIKERKHPMAMYFFSMKNSDVFFYYEK